MGTMQNQVIREVLKPKIKVPKLLFKMIKSFKTKPKPININQEEFKIYVKEKGKFINVGKEKTLKGAKKKLKGNLLSGLQASGFIEFGGKKISAKELSGRLFRPSKVNEDILVQRKNVGGGRLTSFGERTQIKQARKRAKQKSSKSKNKKRKRKK